MEINITEFFNAGSFIDYSASVAEIGADAGQETWQNAIEDSEDNLTLLDSDEKKQAFRDHIKGFGAWGYNEINSWNDRELVALFMQLISGDIRQSPLDNEDWDQYAIDSEDGRCSGNIYKGDDNEIYYYLGV